MTNKIRILILIVALDQQKILLHELASMAEKYEVMFSDSINDALIKLSDAKHELRPIQGLVFLRDTLAIYEDKCKVVDDFAFSCYGKRTVSVNMLHAEDDFEAREFAVIGHNCTKGWKKVEGIFDRNIK